MQQFKILVYGIALAVCCSNNLRVNAVDPVDTDETKRIDMPFIHIGVKKHSDGKKDVDVRAPFVRVHNPAGPNNAQIKAPFTKVDHTQSSSQSQPDANKVSETEVKKDTITETHRSQ
jgi:hypothetical protein